MTGRKRRMLFRMLAAALMLINGCSVHAAPEVWMNHLGEQALGDQGAKWDFVKRNLDGIDFSINAIAFIYPAEKLNALVPILKANHIKIAIECGYFDWQSVSDDFSAPNPKGISDTVRETIRPGVGTDGAH